MYELKTPTIVRKQYSYQGQLQFWFLVFFRKKKKVSREKKLKYLKAPI